MAALLGVWAAFTDNAHGIRGASRHALTVGFVSTMVFAIGQRVLPAFSGMKVLFSTKLMFAALSFLTLGCALRVTSEVLAYQGFTDSAWSWLPLSALTEMAAVTIFAFNLFATLSEQGPRFPPEFLNARDLSTFLVLSPPLFRLRSLHPSIATIEAVT